VPIAMTATTMPSVPSPFGERSTFKDLVIFIL